MAEVHKAGYIHRDLKPDNIFVDDVGGRNDVTIIDFGIAAVKDDSNTFANTTSIAATPFYAPPEQMNGTVSIGNDIFSLGATGYAMLVGNDDLKRDIQNQISPPYDPYFKFQTKTIEDKHLFDVIKKATSPNRRDRFGTMEDMADHLDGAPPTENFPRIIADGHSHPLMPDQNKWMLGRNASSFSEADILINETSPGSTFISRNQAYIERKGECAFQIFHNPSAVNETRIGTQKGDNPGDPITWMKLSEKGYPLGPRHTFICFGYADTPPGKKDEMGNPLQPGPYKVLEYFPPQESTDNSGQTTV
jgi:serine/threonine protein kinase